MDRRFLAGLAAALLLASGCGSDDDAPSAAPGPTASSSSTTSASAPPAVPSDLPAAVYRATTPCDAITRPVPTMAPGAQCEMATWRVELGVDGRYTLDAAYGMAQPNTLGIRDGGTKVQLAGTYAADRGIVTLSTDDPAVSVRFLRVGEDLLHLIDADDELVVGNGGWAYTLNRDGKAGRHTPLVTPVFDEGRTPGGGVFEGRTPCTEDVKAFTPNLVPDCSRLKWRLTLRQNAGGAPAGYVSGVVGREDATEGTWTIRRGLPGFPDAVLYELCPAAPPGVTGECRKLRLLLVGGRHLFMLAADNKLLVGDNYWSYTLSRTE